MSLTVCGKCGAPCDEQSSWWLHIDFGFQDPSFHENYCKEQCRMMAAEAIRKALSGMLRVDVPVESPNRSAAASTFIQQIGEMNRQADEDIIQRSAKGSPP